MRPLFYPRAGGEFVFFASGDLAGWVHKEFPENFLREFIQDPDLFMSRPTRVLRDGTKGKVVLQDLREGEGLSRTVVIKRFHYPSFWRRLAFLVTASPATRCLKAALFLQRKGIGTALPLAALEHRSWTRLGTSYYVTEAISGGKTLGAHWRDDLTELIPHERLRRRRRFLTEVAQLFYDLHARRIYHRDLKSSNILIQERNGERLYFLVDVEGVRSGAGVGWRSRVKNLIQFYRTLGRRLSMGEKAFFLKEYARRFGLGRERRRHLARRALKASALKFSAKTRKSPKWEDPRKISVLFVLGGLPVGGIENLALDLLTHLDRTRLDFKVINLSGKGGLTQEFREKDIEVINTGFHLSTHRLDNTWRLRRLFLRLKPDVLFTTQFGANYHARLAALGLGIKVITQVHDPKRERYLERRLADRVLGRFATDRFIAVSKKVQETLEMAVPASVGKTTLIYNSVSKGRLKLAERYSREAFRRQEGIFPDHVLIVAVGRLVSRKGFDFLLQAFKQVLASMPEARLLIAGEGEMFQHLSGLAESLSLGGKARLLGYYQDLPSLLCASDIFVMPSRWEGFGNAALEAMAMGVPTILTDTSPISELVTDGENALVIPCEVGAIADAIIALARNDRLRRKLGDSGRELFQSMQMGQYTKSVENIFTALAGQ